MPKKSLIWSSVTSEVKELAKRIADSKGISLAEYVRELLLQDFDRRSLTTDDVKRKIAGEEPKTDEPDNQLRGKTD